MIGFEKLASELEAENTRLRRLNYQYEREIRSLEQENAAPRLKYAVPEAESPMHKRQAG